MQDRSLPRVYFSNKFHGDVMAQGRFDSCTKISVLVLLEEWGSSPWHHLLLMPLWRTWLARCSEEAEVGVRFPGEAPDFTRVCTVCRM